MSYLDKAALHVAGTRPIRPDGVDKVTGRANFGADMTMPGMLWGRIKRSPHAQARIVSINTEQARALLGVRAVITRADFSDITPERAHIGAAPHNLCDLSLNCMAKGKVLYEGHTVAAVAATRRAGASGEITRGGHRMDQDAARVRAHATPTRTGSPCRDHVIDVLLNKHYGNALNATDAVSYRVPYAGDSLQRGVATRESGE